MTGSLRIGRAQMVRRGKLLEYLTIAWNGLESLASLVFGYAAGSVALVGFGFDSLIEFTSGGVLLWRLQQDGEAHRESQAERTAPRIVGGCFLALALYIAYGAITRLIAREASHESVPGIVIAVAALIVMPLLAQGKRRVASQLGSAALRADATQTQLCASLSAILLGGLALNALLGWWWADPVAALMMLPLVVKECIEALKGRRCSCGGGA